MSGPANFKPNQGFGEIWGIGALSLRSRTITAFDIFCPFSKP
jgi:hypothetical protein